MQVSKKRQRNLIQNQLGILKNLILLYENLLSLIEGK